MPNDIEKIKEIFLTAPDVDDELREDNLSKIKEWEEGIVHNQAFAEWREHDITKGIIKQCKETYRDMGTVLATNRSLTEAQRLSYWAKQDACAFILSLADKDAKGELERIQREIRVALDAT